MSIDHNRIKVADLEKNLPNKILTTDNNGELEFSDINNTLDCTVAGKVLDARQGTILKDLVDNINLNTIPELVDETVQDSLRTILVNDLTTGGTTKALTAEMGKSLQYTKVGKVTGKSLLSDTEIARLETLSNYTHPTNHPPSIITQDTNNRFVTDDEKETWNAKQSSLGFTAENAANKNVANGYAGLDADGKLISSQLPSITNAVPHQDGTRYTTDFNTILTSGFYNAEGTPANAPGGYGQLIMARGIDTGLQIYGGYGNDNLWFRGFGYGSNEGFHPWRKVIHDNNIGSYALPLTGGTVTGQIESTYRLKLPNLYIGYWDGINNRIESTTRPLMFTSYGTGNDIKFGFDGFDNSLILKQSSGNVGINTANPSEKLEVGGNIKATSFIGPLTGNASTATTSTNSSKLYSTDAIYSVNSPNPYYGYLTYKGNVNRWRFEVSPATPSSVEVSYADNSGNAATATNANNFGNYGITSFEGQFVTNIDASGLDTSTYYPVTIPVAARYMTKISVLVALDSGTVPSWSTHSSGFAVKYVSEVNGSGWGTCDVNRRVLGYDYRYANVSPIGGVTQMNNSSTEVIWVRGGGIYFFYTSRESAVTLRTSSYTMYNETVAPSTSIINNPLYESRGNGSSFGNLYVGDRQVLHSSNYSSYSTFTGTLTNSTNVNSTGDAGIALAIGHRLGFDEGGVRSWTMKAAGGDLTINSGDGNGAFRANKIAALSDSSYYWKPNTSSAHRLQTPTGYLDIGSMNTSWCHFQTDRPRFYFGTSVSIDGDLRRYSDSALYLHSNNYSSYTLSTSGGTLTGLLNIQPSSGNYSEGVRIGNHSNSWSNIQFGTDGTTSGLNADTKQWLVGKNPSGQFLICPNNSDPSVGLTLNKSGNATWNNSILLHSNNYNDYAPSKTGAGANGNWGINITGTSANGFTARPAWATNNSLIEDISNFNASRPSGFYQGYNSANSPGSSWYNMVNVRHSNSGNDHGFQMAMSYYDEEFWTRSYSGGTGNSDGSFTTWRKHLHSGNYISYLSDYTIGNLHHIADYSGSSTWNIRTNGNFIWANAHDWTQSFNLTLSHNSTTNGTYAQFGQSQSNASAGGYYRGVRIVKYLNSAIVDGDFKAGLIEASGDVVAYSSSDKRLKDNIKPIDNAIDKINKIGGYTFDWNDKQSTYTGNDVGVIAQEIEAILPEIVTTRENGYKAVKYEKIVPLLIEAIKEQQTQIEELKDLVNKLVKS
jgi:hypothetical protein